VRICSVGISNRGESHNSYRSFRISDFFLFLVDCIYVCYTESVIPWMYVINVAFICSVGIGGEIP
jgi:hypothetical protein